MIGLLDYDYCVSTSRTRLIPNLEIMKLANYYRQEQQFTHLMSLDQTDLSHYDKIYFFSERAPNIIVPDAFLRAQTVYFGGTNFTNGVYIPFKNSLIDFTLPRTSIYKESLKQKYNEGIKTKVIEHTLDDTYYRMYAGDERLPLPAIIPNKRIYIYDRDFFVPNWQKILDEISERRPSSILCIHPVICTTLNQYFTLREYQKFSRDNTIILDLEIPLEEVYYMFKKYKNLFLADISFNSNVYISLGGSLKTSHQYYRDLIYKLNLLYSFWCKGISIKIKYEPPLIGFKNPIPHLSTLIETWSNIHNQKKQGVSIIDRIPKKKKDNFIKEEYELFIKLYPTTKDLFTQSFNDLKKRRYWRI